MDAPEQMTTDTDEVEEADVVGRLFGLDPWMRFDLWSNRAWEAAESAIKIAKENGDPLAESMDSRVITALNAAQLAKEFAEMVNPFAAAASGVQTQATPSESQAYAIMSMLLDDED